MPTAKKRDEIHIATIFGIPVRLDISWFLIFFLVAWTLALGYFPRDYPGFPLLVYWAMGIISAILLFVSVLIHELSHSFVARQFKIGIGGITLFIFGGMAEMTEEPHSPRSEFFMAVAGPLASGLLLIFFAFCAFVVSNANWARPVYGVFRYLALINGILIVFNLIPGFPLDGGRVLRAVLWHFMGNLRRATFVSSRIGVGFGICLIVFGIMNLFVGNFVAGMWYGFIGLFLRNAAQTSYKQLLYRECLTGIQVEAAMSHPVRTVSMDCSLDELANQYFLRYHYSSFPVVDAGVLRGYVTVNRVQATPRNKWLETTVSSIIETDLSNCVAKAGTPLEEALRQIYSNKINRLFIVGKGDELLGVVTLNDIAAFLKIRLRLMEKGQ